MCPKLIAARKRQLHHNPALPVAFLSGFLPNSPKTGFFHTKHVSKRFPTAFLVLVTLCSSTLEALSYFTTIFATSVANTLSARARTTKNTEKCQKFFHTTLQNVDFSGLSGGTFAVFFLNIQTSQGKTVCTVGNVSVCSTFPPNPILL